MCFQALCSVSAARTDRVIGSISREYGGPCYRNEVARDARLNLTERSSDRAKQHHRKIKDTECEFSVKRSWNHHCSPSRFQDAASSGTTILELAVLNQS